MQAAATKQRAAVESSNAMPQQLLSSLRHAASTAGSLPLLPSTAISMLDWAQRMQHQVLQFDTLLGDPEPKIDQCRFLDGEHHVWANQ